MFQRARIVPYLIFILAPFALLSPILFTDKALFWGVPSTQFIPWWQTAWDTLRQGYLPLWNPWLGMGAPLLANYQSALFYPPTWSYFLLWVAGGTPAMAWGMALLVAVHLAWSGLGMALLIRQIGHGLFSQVISGLAFGLSGYLVARAGFLSINAATAWTPWVILGVTWLVDELVKTELVHNSWSLVAGQQRPVRSRQLLKASLFLSGCIGLQLLSGHAQITWYSLVFGGIWLLFWTYFAYGQSTGNRPTLKLILKCVISYIGMTFVGVGLASMQLLPTVEYLFQSQRAAAVDFEFAMAYSFWPWRWLTLFAPNLFGNPASGDYWGYANYWEDAIYIGLVPFFLALMAVLGRLRRSKLVIFLVSIVILAAVLSLGQNTPVFPWLYRHIPTFDMFQAPTRINLLLVFSLAILAGIGASTWRRPSGRGLYWVRLATMAAVAVTAGAILANFVVHRVLGDIKPSFIQATAMAGIWGIGLGVLTLTAPQENEDIFKSKRSAIWAWAATLWVAVDLIVAGWGLNPGIDLDFYRQSPQTAESVRMAVGEGRLFLPTDDERVLKFDWLFRYDSFYPFPPEMGWEYLRSVMLPNLSSLDNIPTVNNFDPLLPGRYVTWMDVLSKAETETSDRLMNLMAVSVVEEVDISHSYRVNFNPRSTLPRVRWVPCGISVQDGQEALAALIQDGAPTEVVFLEIEHNTISTVCSSEQGAMLEITAQYPGGMTVNIETGSSGYLVLADVWYPGWHAKLDDKPVTILKANYLFKAIEIPSGNHQLELTYQPLWFYIGLGISSLTLIMLGGLVLYMWKYST